MLRPQDGFEFGESGVRLAEVLALEALHDPTAADARRAAVERLRVRAARLSPVWRDRFLLRPENAATLGD
jgi:hypothetical protein